MTREEKPVAKNVGVSVNGGQTDVGGDVVGGNKTVIYQQTSGPVFNPLHQLPPPPGDFTGREEEIWELRAAIATGGVVISGLHGQGGVGKTALALKLADETRTQFPDAQIYLNLLGVSEKPLTPGEAMAYVIRAFHPEAKLPEKEDQLSAIYRSVLDGKRVLLLMDNAKDAAQVRLLVPSVGCCLLVTSRLRFASVPGLRWRNLDTLPRAKAEEFLLKIESRIDREAGAIARLCGYLPQALRLAASALAERADLAPADYARRLANEKNRLKFLDAGSERSDESVEASIKLSYDLFDAEAQRCWRMLAVFPETFDTAAAAAVWEMEGDEVQDKLGRLLQYSMLEWNDKAKRYRLHDLARDFAQQEMGESEHDEAGRRHAAHYLDVLWAADDLYKLGGDSMLHGLALFDAERGNIETGQALVAGLASRDRESARLCSSYPNAGAYFLHLRQTPSESIVWLEAALAAARLLKNRSLESIHLGNLGIAYFYLGETRRAIEYYEQRLPIARELGDQRGEGLDLGNLGIAYAALGQMRRAIQYHEQALAIDRKIADKQSEGQDLLNLGAAYSELGETRRAIEYYEEGLTILHELGDLPNEGLALFNLSLDHMKLGEFEKAIERAEAALKIYEEIKSPNAEALRIRLKKWREK